MELSDGIARASKGMSGFVDGGYTHGGLQKGLYLCFIAAGRKFRLFMTLLVPRMEAATTVASSFLSVRDAIGCLTPCVSPSMTFALDGAGCFLFLLIPPR
jgi:hypothetical protein